MKRCIIQLRWKPLQWSACSLSRSLTSVNNVNSFLFGCCCCYRAEIDFYSCDGWRKVFQLFSAASIYGNCIYVVSMLQLQYMAMILNNLHLARYIFFMFTEKDSSIKIPPLNCKSPQHKWHKKEIYFYKYNISQLSMLSLSPCSFYFILFLFLSRFAVCVFFYFVFISQNTKSHSYSRNKYRTATSTHKSINTLKYERERQNSVYTELREWDGEWQEK
jgi:hypothetical protein